MPAKFTVTKEDLLRSKTVQPGWYTCLVKSVEQAPAKTDGSLNTNVMFVIKGGVFDGVPVDRTFSEKAPGFAVSFIEAVIGRKMTADGGEFDLEQAKGRELKVYIKNETYQNRLVNRAEDFKPAQSA